MRYPLEKYQYFIYQNENGGTTIVAMSTYAGKKVKGYAKCNPEDKFDIEVGKKLAAARCNLKIAEKRKAQAADKYLKAFNQIEEARRYYVKMNEYYIDADDQLDEAAEEVRNILAELNKTE